MNITEFINRTKEQFALVSKLTIEGVVGFASNNEGAVVTIETLERRAIPTTMDVLGLYEVKVDNHGNITGYNRKSLRIRIDTGETN